MKGLILTIFLFAGIQGFSQVPVPNKDPANPCTYDPTCTNEPATRLPGFPYDPAPDRSIYSRENEPRYPDIEELPEDDNIFDRENDPYFDDRTLEDPYDRDIYGDDDLYPEDRLHDRGTGIRDDLYFRETEPSGNGEMYDF